MNMRVRLLQNISRDVASGSNMEPVAAGSDGWGYWGGVYINVLVTAGTQCRDSSIHTVAHIKLLKNNMAIWQITNMQHGAAVNSFFLLSFY